MALQEEGGGCLQALGNRGIRGDVNQDLKMALPQLRGRREVAFV